MTLTSNGNSIVYHIHDNMNIIYIYIYVVANS
jgi:hypothetical protein